MAAVDLNEVTAANFFLPLPLELSCFEGPERDNLGEAKGLASPGLICAKLSQRKDLYGRVTYDLALVIRMNFLYYHPSSFITCKIYYYQKETFSCC